MATNTDEYLVLKNILSLTYRVDRWTQIPTRYLVLKSYAKSYLLGVRMTVDIDGCEVLEIPLSPNPRMDDRSQIPTGT